MNIRAVRPIVKAWVSKPGATIDTASLNDLQTTFGNRLNITHGASGEVLITSQPQDKQRLKEIMQRGEQNCFTEQAIYV